MVRLPRWVEVTAVVAALGYPAAAAACPWDDESYAAEAKSLPCVFDAVLGTYPKHSQEFYLARIRAADAVLDWAPAHLDALDMKGVALLKLKRFSEAEAVMTRRARLAPHAYASHANLGTLYTFTGEWAKALEAIDQAMTIEPQAHFGREKYHRLLVVYLRDLQADAALALRENFLRIPVGAKERLAGSEQAFQRAGAEPDAFDALVAMIAVYGADDVSHVYFALGELLALRGHRRLAWTAYQRAVELKHPRSEEVRSWQKLISEELEAEYRRDVRGWLQRAETYEELPLPTNHGREPLRTKDDIYRSIAITYRLITKDFDASYTRYRDKAAAYTRWEQRQIASGLPVWKPEGLTKLYEQASKIRPRCTSPGVIFHEPLTRVTP